ncbi:molybdate ABC transporter substrate-binding protein [Terasakiella sp.]|uniref:molybdate ABC transporter substrate-binding protein n=1 Tax=Terasakiella sp. TaxID=2034861 RepID=UPI003AA997FE
MKNVFIFLISLLVSAPVYAEAVHVAVAANFSVPLKEIAKAFQMETGHEALVSVGSTGKLYTQIANGAPFDVFLAADQKRPRLAEENGLAVMGSRFTYAMGKLALYPASSPDVLTQGDLVRLAVANPKTAPYGQAAVETLQSLKLFSLVKDKLVYGENIAQTYQFVATQNVDVGFVALSQVVDKPDKWIVPAHYYQPIAQDCVLVKDSPAARAFVDFLKGETARAITTRYGYGG